MNAKIDEYLNIAAALFKNAKIEAIEETASMKHYKIQTSAKQITDKAENEIIEARKTFKMAGFREGQVPVNIIRKRIGPDVLKSVISKVVDNCIKVLLDQKKIIPAMQPEVKIETFEPNQKFNAADEENTGILTFTMKVESLPEAPTIMWDDIRLELLKIMPVEADMKKAHEDILQNFKNYNKTDDVNAVIEMGDSVLIDYNATIAGASFNGSSAENIRVVVNSNELIPGFTDQLVGMKAGAEKQFKLSMPQNYMDPTAAGKSADFNVEVKEIYKPEGVSEINEEFAVSMGLKDLTEFNDLVEKKIEADYGVIARLYNKKKLLDWLDKSYDMEIPESMLKADLEATTAQMMEMMKTNPQVAGKSQQDLMQEFEHLARRRVKTGVIFAQIAKAEGIQISDDDIEKAKTLEKMQRPGQEQMIDQMYEDDKMKARLIGPLLEEKVVDHILVKLVKNITELEITSEEFMQKYSQELTDMAG